VRTTESKAAAAVRIGAFLGRRKRGELGLLRPCFGRVEPWLQAGKYIAALVGEETFEFGKDCFGLGQSQVRLYTAIARHTVLVTGPTRAGTTTAPGWPGIPQLPWSTDQ